MLSPHFRSGSKNSRDDPAQHGVAPHPQYRDPDDPGPFGPRSSLNRAGSAGQGNKQQRSK